MFGPSRRALLLRFDLLSPQPSAFYKGKLFSLVSKPREGSPPSVSFGLCLRGAA